MIGGPGADQTIYDRVSLSKAYSRHQASAGKKDQLPRRSSKQRADHEFLGQAHPVIQTRGVGLFVVCYLRESRPVGHVWSGQAKTPFL